MSSYYATSLYDGKDFGHILVKTRDGRPIKIEGNELSSYNHSGTTARIQASVLSLYDDARIKKPMHNGKPSSWEEVDKNILEKLSEVQSSGKKIVLLSSSIISPSTLHLLEEFVKVYSNFSHVTYDAVSYSGILTAAQKMYGKPVIPDYRFDKADVVVSFGADFLGSWLAPVHFIPSYVSRRKLNEGQKDMLYHIQFESALSLTGSNADERIQIRPSDEKRILTYLYNYIASKKGSLLIDAAKTDKDFSSIAEKLLISGSKAMVISGSNDPECQILVNGLNKLLGNYGVCLEFAESLNLAKGLDNDMESLLNDMEAGKVGALLMHNVNPAYDYPDKVRFDKAIAGIDLSISFAGSSNETAKAAEYICPVPHFLESWDDAEVIRGKLSITQPCIHPIFDTRAFQDSLLIWAGKTTSYLDFIKQYWEENYYSGGGGFTDWWNNCLQKGIYEHTPKEFLSLEYNEGVLDGLSGMIFSEETHLSWFCLIVCRLEMEKMPIIPGCKNYLIRFQKLAGKMFYIFHLMMPEFWN